MPLAPNVVRLDTPAKGLLFQGQAEPTTMRKAAEATLRNGYTHFKLGDASTAHGSQYVGSTTVAAGPRGAQHHSRASFSSWRDGHYVSGQ